MSSHTNSALNNNDKESHTDTLQQLMNNSDIWTNGILEFVGDGHFAFVAGVSKRWRDLYKATFGKQHPVSATEGTKRARTVWKTSFDVVFSSVRCTEFWQDDRERTIYDNSNKNNNPICDIIAKNGCLPVLKWVAENTSFGWTKWTCAIAAANGHLEVLQWLHENGCLWDSSTCTSAAENGQLEVLKWACENKCPLVRRGNGCPWNKSECQRLAELGGHSAVLKWIAEN